MALACLVNIASVRSEWSVCEMCVCMLFLSISVDVDGRGAHVSSHSCELLLSSVLMFFLRSMLTSDDGPESVEVVHNVAM